MSTSSSSLDKNLEAALDSRRRRNILRRLPSPTRPSRSPSSLSPKTSDAADSNKCNEQDLVDFVSNDYLSLTRSIDLRSRVLTALQNSPTILGSGGSRLLVNPAGHAELEARLQKFFQAPTALLFNSGFDANASLFSCLPQAGDVVVHDEAIHASVHDGLRTSRLDKNSRISFHHNSLDALREVLLLLVNDATRGPGFRAGEHTVFIAVEALYSMDGTLAPLPEIVSLIGELFPRRNGLLIVDEAHAVGVYGPKGRGLVAHYGLEDKVFVRLVTFGKALASSGAVVLCSELLKSYLLNYARPLIYTTALSCASVVSINCSLDLLDDGTAIKLAQNLHELIHYTLTTIQSQLRLFAIPQALLALPTHLIAYSLPEGKSRPLLAPIIPLMTPLPRPLSAHLRTLGLNARPITWPTVPKGKDRVRLCLHAGNTKEDVDRLVAGAIEWARKQISTNSGSIALPGYNIGVEEALAVAKL